MSPVFILPLLLIAPPLKAQIAVSLEAEGIPLFQSPGWTIGGEDLSEFSPAFSYRWGLIREPIDLGEGFGQLTRVMLNVVIPMGGVGYPARWVRSSIILFPRGIF